MSGSLVTHVYYTGGITCIFCASTMILLFSTGDVGDKGQKGSIGRHGKIGPIGSKGICTTLPASHLLLGF